jgi:hypothetical protein
MVLVIIIIYVIQWDQVQINTQNLYLDITIFNDRWGYFTRFYYAHVNIINLRVSISFHDHNLFLFIRNFFICLVVKLFIIIFIVSYILYILYFIFYISNFIFYILKN